MAGLVEEGRAVDIVCLDFIKAFDTASLKILTEKLCMGLDELTVRWVKKKSDWVQNVVVSRTKSSWRCVTVGWQELCEVQKGEVQCYTALQEWSRGSWWTSS